MKEETEPASGGEVAEDPVKADREISSLFTTAKQNTIAKYSVNLSSKKSIDLEG